MKPTGEMTDAEVAAELEKSNPFGVYTTADVKRFPEAYRKALRAYRGEAS